MREVSNRMCQYFSEREGYSVSWRAKLFAKNYKHKSLLLDSISGSLLHKSFYKI